MRYLLLRHTEYNTVKTPLKNYFSTKWLVCRKFLQIKSFVEGLDTMLILSIAAHPKFFYNLVIK